MKNVNLTIKAEQLLPLQRILQAHYDTIVADPNVTTEERHLVCDLLKRVALRHNMEAAEQIARSTRKKYAAYISRPDMAPDKPVKVKPTASTTAEETAQEAPPEPSQATGKAVVDTTSNRVTVIKRPI